MPEQLAALSKPFPDNLVERLPGKGAADYVAHGIVKQRLLEVVGPYSFEVVQIVNPSTVIGRLTCEVDGVTTVVEEFGVSTNSNDAGDQLASAYSRALCKCASHIGLGLHLWNPKSYWLHVSLTREEATDARD